MKKLICLDCRYCKTLSQAWGDPTQKSGGWCVKWGIILTAYNIKLDNLSTYWGCFNAKEKEKRIMGVRFAGGTKVSAESCVVLGLIDTKNNVTLDNVLDLRGMKDLLVVDLDYFLEHRADVLLAVKSVKNI